LLDDEDEEEEAAVFDLLEDFELDSCSEEDLPFCEAFDFDFFDKRPDLSFADAADLFVVLDGFLLRLTVDLVLPPCLEPAAFDDSAKR